MVWSIRVSHTIMLAQSSSEWLLQPACSLQQYHGRDATHSALLDSKWPSTEAQPPPAMVAPLYCLLTLAEQRHNSCDGPCVLCIMQGVGCVAVAVASLLFAQAGTLVM